MIKKLTLSTILLWAGLDFAFPQFAALTANAPRLEVIATNGAGNEKHLSSINGVVPMVMVRPNQIVPITLQFPTDKAGTPIAASPLDGGRINGGNMTVLPTGKVVFTFSPGPVSGRYRVMIRTPREEHLLEFYVVDPSNPPQQPRK
ncbi:MAG: hypothetical protein ABR611_07705 [Chthoniobacterales bacterium]